MPSSRHQPAASIRPGFHTVPPFRPRRFSRPRRLPPLLALWVYFTPQPRPGFALQGFVPLAQPPRLSAPRALSSVGDSPLLAVAHQRHVPPPRPQGFPSVRGFVADIAVFSRHTSSIPSLASPPSGFPSRRRENAFTSSAARDLDGEPVESFPPSAFSVPSSSPACLSRGCRPVRGSWPAVLHRVAPALSSEARLFPAVHLDRQPCFVSAYGLNHIARAVPTAAQRSPTVRSYVFEDLTLCITLCSAL